MKFLSLAIMIFICCISYGQAPSYTDFELDILRIGYSNPTGDTPTMTSAGVSFGGELRYNVKDDLSIGLGGNGSLFGTDFENDSTIGTSSSGFLTLDKYFSTTSANRAFAGVALGRYQDGSLTIKTDQEDIRTEGEKSFGVAPRAGFELGHVRLMAAYHYTFKSDVTNFFNVNIALTLWGGYQG